MQSPLTPIVEEYWWTTSPALSRREREVDVHAGTVGLDSTHGLLPSPCDPAESMQLEAPALRISQS